MKTTRNFFQMAIVYVIGVVVSLGVCWAREGASRTDTDGTKSKQNEVLFSNQFFDAPKMLMVDGVPLNTYAKKRYPSPELYDIDNDGVNELVVGDIFGAINVYENSKPKSAEPEWKKFKPLKTSDGNKIKVSNW